MFFSYLHEFLIDFVDDLEMSWEEGLQHGHGPALECLGEQSVVGVGEGAHADIPGLVPLETLDVHEETHQLRNADRGMCVVQLNCHLQVQISMFPKNVFFVKYNFF